MDLKDVIASVDKKAMEAHNAFHAGHHDVAKGYLDRIGSEIANYLYSGETPAGDVTESATSEKPKETSKEKPAQGPKAAVRPAAVDPVFGSQKDGHVPESQKQTR